MHERRPTDKGDKFVQGNWCALVLPDMPCLLSLPTQNSAAEESVSILCDLPFKHKGTGANIIINFHTIFLYVRSTNMGINYKGSNPERDGNSSREEHTSVSSMRNWPKLQ